MKTGSSTRAGLVNCGASNKSVTSHNYGKTIYKRANSEFGMFHRHREDKHGQKDGVFYATESHIDPAFKAKVNKKHWVTNTKRNPIKGNIGYGSYDTLVIDGVMIKLPHEDTSKKIKEETKDTVVIQETSGKKIVHVACTHKPQINNKLKSTNLHQKMKDRFYKFN